MTLILRILTYFWTTCVWWDDFKNLAETSRPKTTIRFGAWTL